MNLLKKINASTAFILKERPVKPEVGIVLGSGLGDLAEAVSNGVVYDYAEIPHFKRSKVAGHLGRLHLGQINDKSVGILQGRCHYYEGHSMDEVVFSVRVLCALGIHSLLLTNSAGGINPDFEPGDLMIIEDHINLMGSNPLRGISDEKIGPRFPDLSRVYDETMISIISQCLRSLGADVRKGVYAAVSGPSYDTPAEIGVLAKLGVDAVGMSTVPEAIAAKQMGVKVAGISCITNRAAGKSPEKIDHEAVLKTAGEAGKKFKDLLPMAIPRFA